MAEFLGIVIAAIAIIWLLSLLVRYVLAPIAGILLIIGAGYALILSVKSFIQAVSANLSPYDTYVDSSPNAPHNVRRNYFFGPGYHQIGRIISAAFSNMRANVNRLLSWVRGKDRALPLKIGAYIIVAAAFICMFILGFSWTIALSAVLFVIIFVIMCVFYLLFSLLWLADRVYLLTKSISCRCPNCKRVSIIPAFECPSCGTIHRKLTPGPYGIFSIKCDCGKKLPTTVFGGRTRLTAKCPFCETEIAVSNAQQFGIQLVGGVNAGKTTFLSAFMHEYRAYLNDNEISYDVEPKDAFDELEYWYENGDSSATSDMNAVMYSIIQTPKRGSVYQFSIYDTAGEAFAQGQYAAQQQQYAYCGGIVFIIDAEDKSTGAIEQFLTDYRRERNISANRLSGIPATVLITKSDLHKRQIGIPKINAEYRKTINGLDEDDKAEITLERVQNDICHSFLESKGLGNVLNLLESSFSEVRYFPVSAMGHTPARGIGYEPWGVIAPIRWIAERSKPKIAEILQLAHQ